MTYNFKHLSGADFEELVHDLLQADWETELEIFAGGRDGGVDLRREDKTGLTIVQCKNYEGSGYAALRGRMRDEELLKIRQHQPDRYVLVCSVDLTVGQKDELFALLSPWVITRTDIVGKKELTAKLEAHSAVVKRHHKLWLTSVSVMEQILQGAERLQTSTDILRMQRKLDVYVETDALPRAVQILESDRVLVISGEPGIGKSTLADMIILDHVANGFQPAIVRSSLNEGRLLAAAGGPTIFYFDDFLGQTYLGDRPDFLGKREDADLVHFIEWVRNSEDHRFVLTTREHVLAEALMRSERLRHAGFADGRCVLTIRDLNRAQRARILYNHLEFSALPREYKLEMLRDDFFLEVIDFERFNPRVVQWLSSYNRVKSVPVEQYQEHVRSLMENPLEIWRHAFDQELSQAARDVLVALYSFTYRAYLDDLESCFDTLHAISVKRLNERTTVGAFKSAMKELDGSFLTISNKGEVKFINPSIADFIATVLRDDFQLVLDLVNAAVHFTQVSMLLEASDPGGPLVALGSRLRDNGPIIAGSLSRLLQSPHLRWFDTDDGKIGHYVDFSPPARATRLIELSATVPQLIPVAEEMLALVGKAVQSGHVQINESTSLLKTALTSRGSWESLDDLIDAVRHGLGQAYAEDWLAILDLKNELGIEFSHKFPEADGQFQHFLDNQLSEERLDCDSVQRASDLMYTLEALQERHEVKLSYEIGELAERLPELEAREGANMGDTTSEDFFPLSLDSAPGATDNEIRSMYGKLLG